MQRLKYLEHNGKLLSAELNVIYITPKVSLTIENTIERIEAISKASTHEEKLYVTRGVHLTLGDMFKAA